jgi:hypothetical protein
LVPVPAAFTNVVIDAVLDVRSRIGRAEDPFVVRFVLGKKKRLVAFDKQPAFAQFRVRRRNDAYTSRPSYLS